jgi:uncharacterized LabA/DUF88 family protein
MGARAEKEVFERLGSPGLSLVLDDLLDQTRLARLATACGLSYPGIRTRSQKRDRLLADLIDKAGDESAARKAIFRTLKKETAADSRAWLRLDADERDRRLKDERYLLTRRRLGLHLFLLACSPNGPEDDGALERLASLRERRSSPPQAERSSSGETKEIARLRKSQTELRKKIRHLENQVAKSRDTEKRVKKELIERKGELAESRMLAERLQREADKARRSAGAIGREDGDLAALTRSVRKLATEQRKLTHAVAKIAEASANPVEASAETLSPIAAALDKLNDETASLRKDWRAERKALKERLEEVREEVRSVRSASRAGSTPSRRKGAAGRIGVFIDVQNVYYGARRLKGKLDFDALLQAVVRDRRLIQATAYVVESKEIDQSGFIAMLQQRAISVRRKTLKVRSDGSMKGDWDMEMALDILDAAPKLSVVVLVSGDGDFTSLVKRVKGMGPRVEVVGFPRNTAKSLLEAADSFQPLDRKFMIRAPKTTAGASRASKTAKVEKVAD